MSVHLRQAGTLLALTMFGFALFVGFFAAGLLAAIPILFYRGVALAACAAVVTGIASLLTGGRGGGAPLAVPAAALVLSITLCFLVILPVTVDRSISVYVLATIESHARTGILAEELEDAFIAGYVRDMHAIDRRVVEQRRSGNITIDTDGHIRLTPQGARFMRLSRFVASAFATDPRFVTGRTGAGPR